MPTGIYERRYPPWNKGLGDGKRAYTIALRARVKARLDALKLERGCIDCGYSENVDALQFDHIDRTTKIGNGVLTHYKTPRKLEMELAKCVVRCANCHAIRTAEQRRNGWK